VCFEETLERSGSELAMRVRVAIRSISALVSERRFLSFFSDPLFAWQLWSHKLLRYSSPYWIILMLTACWALTTQDPVIPIVFRIDPIRVVLVGQLAILAAGVAGFLLRHWLLSKPYYFLLTNLASLVATLRYLMGERMVTWQPVR
jgi:hypothetical protein